MILCYCFLMAEREGLRAGLEPEQSSLGQEGLASGRLTPLRPGVNTEPGGLVFSLRSRDESGLWENEGGMRRCWGEWEGTQGHTAIWLVLRVLLN